MVRYFQEKIRVALRYPKATVNSILFGNKRTLMRSTREYACYIFAKKLNFSDQRMLQYLQELEQSKIYNYIYEKRKTWRKVDSSNMTFFKGSLIFVITRLLKPSVIVETGVASGVSTLFLLLGLNSNHGGKLFSIDLPNADAGAALPPGADPGWIIPNYLRGRWSLVIGDTGEVLPKLLEELSTIDMFIHDSLHTYEHMLWEYACAWQWLRMGGLLLSDDAIRTKAMNDFSKLVRRKPVIFRDFGGLRK